MICQLYQEILMLLLLSKADDLWGVNTTANKYGLTDTIIRNTERDS